MAEEPCAAPRVPELGSCASTQAGLEPEWTFRTGPQWRLRTSLCSRPGLGQHWDHSLQQPGREGDRGAGEGPHSPCPATGRRGPHPAPQYKRIVGLMRNGGRQQEGFVLASVPRQDHAYPSIKLLFVMHFKLL